MNEFERQRELEIERRRLILKYELEYGPDLERRRQALLLEVEAAFGDVRKGDGIGIREAAQHDATHTDSPEAAAAVIAARAADIEQRWQDIPKECLAGFYEPFIWTDRKGFHFLLPAYIQYFLQCGWNCTKNSYDIHITIAIMTLGNSVSYLDEIEFTPEQILCIKNFIEWVVDCNNQFTGEDFVVELLDWCNTRILTG